MSNELTFVAQYFKLCLEIIILRDTLTYMNDSKYGKLFQHQIIWIATLFHLPIISIATNFSIQAADQFSQFFSLSFSNMLHRCAF